MEKCLKFRKSKGKNSVPLYLEEKVRKEENWPTPRAGNPGSRKPGTGGKILAEEAKKNWGTPQARDWKGAQGRAYKGGAKDLPAQTEGVPPHAGLQDPEKSSTSGRNQESWPTPNTSDQYNPNIPHDVGRSYLRTESLPEDQRKPNPTMKLNPNWVEQLQGLEVGLTQLPTEWIDSDS